MPHLPRQPIRAVSDDRLPLSLTPHYDGLNPVLTMLGRLGLGDPTCIELRLVVDSDLTFMFRFVDLSSPIYIMKKFYPCSYSPSPTVNPPSSVHLFSFLFIAAQTQIHYTIRTRHLRPHFEYPPINTKATFSAERKDFMTPVSVMHRHHIDYYAHLILLLRIDNFYFRFNHALLDLATLLFYLTPPYATLATTNLS
jgi:hypothetical protein